MKYICPEVTNRRMLMDTPLKTVFYSIERTIKEYRKFAQRHLALINPDITVDQALILMIVSEDDTISQRDLARLLFRDNASVTRTIQLMVKNGFITREPHSNDRRQMQLKVSRKGNALFLRLVPIVREYRRKALADIAQADLTQLVGTLDRIYQNCERD